MHRLLRRQLERLGLGAETPPGSGPWNALLERVSASYTQADETRKLSERSMELSSGEMLELHERERRANALLEERVRQRTADLEQAERAARLSEVRFRTTFDSAPLGIAHMSVEEGTILLANAKLGRMFGCPGEQLLGMKMDEFIPPEPADDAQARYQETLLKGELDVHASERRCVRRDGTQFWVNWTVSLVRDASGKPVYFICVIEDIDERVQAAKRRALEHAVTHVLAESVTLEEAMPIVLRTICLAQGWICGAYWRWSESQSLLWCTATWHADVPALAEFVAESKEAPNEAPAWHGAPPGTRAAGVVRRVWFAGAPVWIPDIVRNREFRRAAAAQRAGIHAAFGFPVLAGTRPYGVLEFYSREMQEPDEALLQMVRAIGSQLGQFIQRKQAEDKVLQLAQFDTVTGLPNRNLFSDRLAVTVAQARRNAWPVALLFLDLDRFKTVNDTYGHAAGDALLRQVAARLRECLRGSDVLGRLGGDEFAIVLPGPSKPEDAGLVAQKVIGALSAPFDVDGQPAYVSASIGIALYPSDGESPDTLLRNADAAMYRAKDQGRDGYQYYLPEMNERLKERVRLEGLLRQALDRQEFRLHYQPKVDLRTGAICGLEALLRWEHDGRLVTPMEFIPILEYTGLIVPVGEWVMRSVCEQISRWQKSRLAVRPVAINLSARQFQSKDICGKIGAILKDSGIAPQLLEVELTESLLMSDAEEAVNSLRDLKALGVRIAVDDFGTGYSSLAYLKRFPLDALKIDRAFVRDAVSDPDDAAITLTIISLARSLKLISIAEGVETREQVEFLRANGCAEIQGFYFSRPLPVEECTQALIEDRRLALAP